MSSVIYLIKHCDQYRGSEFSSEGFGAPEKANIPMVPQNPTASIDERGHKDDQTAREERLESFMKEVKDFIRSIDVSRL